MKKVLIITGIVVVAIVLIVVLGGYFTANRFFNAKSGFSLRSTLTESMGKRVDYTDLKVKLGLGVKVEINGFSIVDSDYPDKPLIHAGKVYADMKLLPLLSKKIEVVRITIDNPEIYWNDKIKFEQKEKKPNSTTKSSKPEKSKKESAMFSLSVPEIGINKGKFTFETETDTLLVENINLNLQVSVNNLDKDKEDYSGTLEIKNIDGSYGPYNWQRASGSISLNQDKLSCDELIFATSLGRYWMKVDLSDWSHFGVKDVTRPKLTFHVISPLADFSKLPKQEKANTEPDSLIAMEEIEVEQKSDINNDKLELPLDVQGIIDFKKVKTEFIEINSLKTLIGANNDKIYLNVETSIAGGRVNLETTLINGKTKSLKDLGYKGELTISHMSLQEVSKSLIKDDFLEGNLYASFDVQGTGVSLQDMVSTMEGQGTISLKEGYFYLPDNVREFGKYAKTLKNDKIKVNVENTSTYKKGILKLDNLVAESDVADATISGYIKLTGYINTKIVGKVSRQVSKELKIPGKQMFFDEEKRLGFKVTVKGSFEEPEVKFYWAKLTGQIWKNVKRGVGSLIKGLF